LLHKRHERISVDDMANRSGSVVNGFRGRGNLVSGGVVGDVVEEEHKLSMDKEGVLSKGGAV
jgi:hypothetical protein